MVEMCDSPVHQETRYDRQLRLWGEHGQTALEGARVLCIGVNATTCEVAKNLILPGIGRLILMDHSTVSLPDVMSNFFLTEDDIDKTKSEAAFHWLSELNPSVKCSYEERRLEYLLDEEASYFKEFSLIIISRICPDHLDRLKNLLYNEHIPLIQVESFGMFGRIRLVIKEHAIFEAHPDFTLPDLRLDRPFPELIRYCDSFNLDNLDSAKHKHVPYIVPLYKALSTWRDKNDQKMPDSKGKREIKAILNSMRRFEDEENFDEGEAAVVRSTQPTRVPSQLVELFSSSEFLEKNLDPTSSQFWILLKTLKRYLDHSDSEGFLPLQSKLPDMFSDSENYVNLLKIYRDQSQKDLDLFCQILADICSDIGVLPPDDNLTKRFCMNASGVKIQTGNEGRTLNDAWNEHQPGEDSAMIITVLFDSALSFFRENSRFPGDCETDDELQSDEKEVTNLAVKIARGLDTEPHIKKGWIEEIVRTGGIEIHTVASYLGGLAAQEIIKVLTGQYVPIENTLLYNAITQEVQLIKL